MTFPALGSNDLNLEQSGTSIQIFPEPNAGHVTLFFYKVMTLKYVFCSIYCSFILTIKHILSFNTNCSKTFFTPYFHKYFPPLNSFHSLVRKLFKFSWNKGKIIATTVWNFLLLRIQKRIVSAENIQRNMVHENRPNTKELLPRKVLISVDITFNSYTKLSENR